MRLWECDHPNILVVFPIQVSSVEDATIVKVVPTPNNGFTELVALIKEKVSVGYQPIALAEWPAVLLTCSVNGVYGSSVLTTL